MWNPLLLFSPILQMRETEKRLWEIQNSRVIWKQNADLRPHHFRERENQYQIIWLGKKFYLQVCHIICKCVILSVYFGNINSWLSCQNHLNERGLCKIITQILKGLSMFFLRAVLHSCPTHRKCIDEISLVILGIRFLYIHMYE